jgi:hypothetical protein
MCQVEGKACAIYRDVDTSLDRYYIGTIDKLDDKQAVITATMDGIIVSCNQNTEELFG